MHCKTGSQFWCGADWCWEISYVACDTVRTHFHAQHLGQSINSSFGGRDVSLVRLAIVMQRRRNEQDLSAVLLELAERGFHDVI